jgi:hypothetical protein
MSIANYESRASGGGIHETYARRGCATADVALGKDAFAEVQLTKRKQHLLHNASVHKAYLNQPGKAKAVYQEAVKRKLYGDLHASMYGVAFLEHDIKEMEHQASWPADKSGVADDTLLSYQSDTEAFSGRLKRPGNSPSAQSNPPT